MAISVTVLIVLSGHWWRCLSNANWFRGTDGLGRLFLEVSSSCLYRSYFNFRVRNSSSWKAPIKDTESVISSALKISLRFILKFTFEIRYLDWVISSRLKPRVVASLDAMIPVQSLIEILYPIKTVFEKGQ